MRAPWLALAVAVAAGCVAPEVARPLPELPVAGVAPATSVTRPRRLAIDLPSALDLAGGRSPELLLAKERVTEAEDRLLARAFSFVPTAYPIFRVFDHRGQAQPQAGTNVYVHRSNYETQGLAAFRWDAGPAIFELLAARRRIDAARARTETARLETMVRAATAYFELVRAQGELTVARAAIEDARELLRLEESLERAGAGLRARVLRARALAAERAQDVVAARGRIAIASARLAEVLLLEPDVELVAREDLPADVALFARDATLGDLVAHALVARPELREGESELEARERDRDAVLYGRLVPFVASPIPLRVAYPPLVPATEGLGSGDSWSYAMHYTPWSPFGAIGRSGFFGPSLVSLTFSQDWMVYVGVGFGPGGAFDLPAIRAGALRERARRVELDALRARLPAEVAAAHAELVAARERVAAARAGVTAAREAARRSRDLFEKGGAIQLEVLDAEEVLARSELARVEALADQDVAQYRLLRAVGTLPP